MGRGALRGILVLVGVGLVVTIAMGSALPIVLAICVSGLVAAGSVHSHR